VATLQALGLLPIIGAQGTDCADLFVPFAPTSDDLLCSLVDLALPFLLGGLTGGLIGPGLLAFWISASSAACFSFRAVSVAEMSRA
jgi:hypothetical protein